MNAAETRNRGTSTLQRHIAANTGPVEYGPGQAPVEQERVEQERVEQAAAQAHHISERHFFNLRPRGMTAESVPRPVLIAGEASAGAQLSALLHRYFPHRYAVIGLVTREPVSVSPDGVPVLGSLDDLGHLAQLHHVHDVMIADFFAPGFKADEERITAQTSRLGYHSTTSALSPDTDSRYVKALYVKALKRGLDITVSLAALSLPVPLLALLAAAIKLTCSGPVLFVQERVGLGGKVFRIYKLRTMHLNAEAATGPILAQHGDERCWPLGALLRASHLDELPQLYDALRGEMSIVGQRPERPIFVSMYERHVPLYAQRHTVLPGLTGLAQTSGDQLTHVNIKLHYDLMYVYNCSLWLDALILARTPLEILRSLGRKEGK